MPRANWSKKRYRSEFLQTSFIFVIHLFKGVSLCLVALFTDYLLLNLYVYEPIQQWAGLLPQLIFYSFFLRPVESVIKREKRKKTQLRKAFSIVSLYVLVPPDLG